MLQKENVLHLFLYFLIVFLHIFKDTLFTEAVKNGDTGIVRFLKEDGADVNAGSEVVRGINCKSYKELGRSLKVKYFIAFELNVERSCKFFLFLSCCFFGRVIVPPQS